MWYKYLCYKCYRFCTFIGFVRNYLFTYFFYHVCISPYTELKSFPIELWYVVVPIWNFCVTHFIRSMSFCLGRTSVNTFYRFYQFEYLILSFDTERPHTPLLLYLLIINHPEFRVNIFYLYKISIRHFVTEVSIDMT